VKTLSSNLSTTKKERKEKKKEKEEEEIPESLGQKQVLDRKAICYSEEPLQLWPLTAEHSLLPSPRVSALAGGSLLTSL
jgi:hypothetical protein